MASEISIGLIGFGATGRAFLRLLEQKSRDLVSRYGLKWNLTVTANKGPPAFAYRELRGLARERSLSFRFESAVMDGTPVFNLVEKTLPAAQILGFYGILKSTSNFVLTGI